MNSLTLRNHQGLAVDINPEAEKRKSDLCEKAIEIVTIDDDFTMEIAVGCLRSLKRFLDEIEDSRKEIKAPVLTIGKTIDTKAQEFSAGLATEQVRINKLVTAYNNEKTRQNAIAEAKRLAELKRIEEERIAAEKAAALERQRLEEEAAKTSAAMFETLETDTPTPAPSIASQPVELKDEHRKRRLELEAAEAALVAAEAVARQNSSRIEAQRKSLLTVSHAAPKPEGLSMRNTPRFEITDIHALYKARPELVAMEVKTQAVQTLIRDGTTELPGLRIWMEQVASVRGSK